MKKSSKSMYIVSDIHCGSTMAVCTEKPVCEETGEYKPNALQREFCSIWNESIDELQQKPDICVINGEPIDGGNPKQLGNQSWSTSMLDQAIDSMKLLKRIPAKEYLFIRGSGYHVQVGGTPVESFIADKMNAKKYDTITGVESNSWYWANLEMNGKKFSFTHHTPYAKFFAYRATPLAKEMALMSLDAGRSMKYDVIVRSHVHYYMRVHSAHTIAFTTPAWKYPDGHLTRGGLGGIYPDIGAIEVIVESNGKIEIIEHLTELKLKQKTIKI
ncbi:metallophosphatase [Nitrososphaeria virus YSH_1032793]|uniref:Metallophosphatase n=1 Tax=Nitrososphaeria virus YSH_1032793 TaxID=3071320 RepID=A0A976UAE2_9CAUD|nr:metallophosphatase [Yangshan Harbor Nitrososphaeria virus]UVF62265.1 metallophosphatase [Nitrososphaeria virus YSH_1032793]